MTSRTSFGLIRTDAVEVIQEFDTRICSTLLGLERGTFKPACSHLDHEALCRQIQLDASQRALIAERIVVTDGGGQRRLLPGARPGRGYPSPSPRPNCKRVTPIERRLCESYDEMAFVEALVVHAMHKYRDTAEDVQDGVIRMTHDQIRRIAAERHDGVGWGPQQIERLKHKYVTRELDSKPASRFELLWELSKGERRRGHARGRPSEYRATGIVQLLHVPIALASDDHRYALR